jgi:type IV pilus assembly protein PilC
MADQSEQIDFIWQGIDKNRKKSGGVIPAKNELIAKTELRRQGYLVTKIKKKPIPFFSARMKAITPNDIAIFSRQLATMLAAGIPLVQSFDIIGKGHENPSMQILLLAIKANIENGDSLAEALKKNPLYFDELFCNLVYAGEHAGILDTLLDKIATYKEKTESMKKKIKKALTYPIAVIVVAFIVTTILLLFVVPVFEDMFKNFGADLPAFTRMVVTMSQWFKEWWWIVLGVIITSIYTF